MFPFIEDQQRLASDGRGRSSNKNQAVKRGWSKGGVSTRDTRAAEGRWSFYGKEMCVCRRWVFSEWRGFMQRKNKVHP